MLLAIDQATVTGYAYCEPGQEPKWGHKTLGRTGEHDEIVEGLELLLCSLIDKIQPSTMIFERPFLGIPNTETILLLGALRGVILLVGRRYGVRVHDQETRAAVKLLTGHGKFPGATS